MLLNILDTICIRASQILEPTFEQRFRNAHPFQKVQEYVPFRAQILNLDTRFSQGQSVPLKSNSDIISSMSCLIESNISLRRRLAFP